MKKRGISAVVAAVLIILITVAAVTLIWQGIIPMIKDNLDFSELEGRVEVVSSRGYTFYDPITEMASVQIKRGMDDVEMDDVVIIFSVDGNSFRIPAPAPAPGNTKVYTFDMSIYGEPDSISVAPVFVLGEKEKEGSVTSEFDVSKSYGSVTNLSNLNLVVAGDSLIDSDSWSIGNGSVVGYAGNGDSGENVRKLGIGPYRNEVLLWVAVNQDGDCKSCPSRDRGDGGWDSATIPIDHNKTYRSTIWIKKTGSIDGRTYFGTYKLSTNLLNGTSKDNPYFWSGDLPELDKWYLLVGYIHGSGDNSTISYGGIYDGVTGEKVISMTDFKNKVNAIVQQHRTYLYYDTNTTDRQYFWNPTFTDVSGYDLPLEVQV